MRLTQRERKRECRFRVPLDEVLDELGMSEREEMR